jgi:indole-3-glycerol phosphate synthase
VNFLETIIGRKRIKIEEAKKRLSLADLKRAVREPKPGTDFKKAITRREGEPLKVIAEIKRASPSKGTIAENIDPVDLANDYKVGGASAISVLTEEDFFKGSTLDLQAVHDSVPDMPLLRKDFIIDEYQIYESVLIGASAILLIVAALDKKELKDFIALAGELKTGSLVEVHGEDELERALSAGAEMVGVNNRNLITFEVSPAVSEQLAKKLPKEIISVCESGIRDVSGLQLAFEAGYHAVLIGEHFMRAADRAAEVKKFTSVSISRNSKIRSQSFSSKAKS